MEQQEVNVMSVVISRCHYCGAFREKESDFQLPKKGEMADSLFKCQDCGQQFALQFQKSDKPREYFVAKGILKDNNKVKLKGGEKIMAKNKEDIDDEEIEDEEESDDEDDEEVEKTEKKPKKEKKSKSSQKAFSGEFKKGSKFCVCSKCGKSKFARLDVYDARVKKYDGNEKKMLKEYVCRECKAKQKNEAKK